MSDYITTTTEGSYPISRSGHPSKVAVIGAGVAGSTLTYACVTKGVACEVVLQDVVEEKVEAEALDIVQGIQFTSAGSISGSNDPEIYRDAGVIVATTGARQKPGQSHLGLAGATVGIVEKILSKPAGVAPNAIFIPVVNPVDMVTYCVRKITGLSENQVFGSGTVLDAARTRHLISLEAGTAVQNIHGYIADEHGDSEVPLWSSTEIGGVPVTQWGITLDGGAFDEPKHGRITHDAVRSAYRIIGDKDITDYVVDLAMQRIIDTVLDDEQRVLATPPLPDNWHDISSVCMVVPTIVGRRGIGRRLELPLAPEEKERLTASVDHLREITYDLGY